MMVAGLAKIISAPLKALGIISTPRVDTASALPAATRDDAAAQVLANDELARRKGGAADILNGASGAEPASAGGKVTLGS